MNLILEVKKRLLTGSPLAVRAWALANDIKGPDRLIDLAYEQIKKEGRPQNQHD